MISLQGGQIVLWHEGRKMPRDKIERLLRESRPTQCSEDCPVWRAELATYIPDNLEVNVEEGMDEVELGPTIEEVP